MPSHRDAESGDQGALRRIPWALLFAAFALLDGIVAYSLFTHESPNSSVGQRVYATVVLFVGSYTDLGGVPQPTNSMSIVATIAVVSTFVAIGSVLLAAVTSVQRWLRAIGGSPLLVVIGSDVQATKIIQSCHAEGTEAVLIAESKQSPAALKAGKTLVLFAAATPEQFLRAANLPRTIRQVLGTTGRIVVATDSDAANVALQQQIEMLGKEEGWAVNDATGSAVFAVVQSAELADALRGVDLKADQLRTEIACPDENLAEHVGQLLKAMTGLAASADIPERIVVGVVTVSDDAATLETRRVLELWLTRMTWSLKKLSVGLEEGIEAGYPYSQVPRIDLDNEDRKPHVLIAIGEPTKVASWALTQPQSSDRLTIVLSSPDLMLASTEKRDRSPSCFESWHWLGVLRRRRAAEISHVPDGGVAPAPGFTWGEVVVVDADAVRFDHRLMVDGRVSAWARAFHQAYGVMYGGGLAEPWAPSNTPEREQQSSVQAVENMVKFLAKDFVLGRVLGDEEPQDFVISDAARDDIARQEHENWRTRTYKDWKPGTRSFKIRRVAEKRPLRDTSWEELVTAAETLPFRVDQAPPELDESTARQVELAKTCDYNRRVVTAVYPFIAALLGYEIRPKNADSDEQP